MPRKPPPSFALEDEQWLDWAVNSLIAASRAEMPWPQGLDADPVREVYRRKASSGLKLLEKIRRHRATTSNGE